MRRLRVRSPSAPLVSIDENQAVTTLDAGRDKKLSTISPSLFALIGIRADCRPNRADSSGLVRLLRNRVTSHGSRSHLVEPAQSLHRPAGDGRPDRDRGLLGQITSTSRRIPTRLLRWSRSSRRITGRAPRRWRSSIGIPLETALNGMPGLKYLRSISLAGLNDIKCQFEYGTDYWAARQEVINRIGMVSNLPPGSTRRLSPWSPTGEIVRYVLEGRRLYAEPAQGGSGLGA